MGCFLMVSALTFGCSPPPVKLARQITDADVIVAEDEEHGYRLSITNEDVKIICQAVCGSRKSKAPCDCIFTCQIDFFKGTNKLATVHSQGSAFVADEGEYIDHSGQLFSMQRKWESNLIARKLWMKDLAGDLKKNPQLDELQKWSLEVLRQAVTNHSAENLLPQELPEWLRTSPSLSNATVWPASNGISDYLVINRGSWCLLVGSTNYTPSQEYGYVTNIAPGIYMSRDDLGH